MKRAWVALVVLASASRALAASPEAVDEAIRKGIQFLYKSQTEKHHWERVEVAPPPMTLMGAGTDGGQWGGRTALCTYALLAAGERPTDKRISDAVEWLRTASITGTYSVAMRANVWFNLPQTPANIASMKADAARLAKTRSNSGDNRGLFTYQGGSPIIDISCSQFGVLGSWAAAQRINVFDVGYWAIIEKAWHDQQNEDGGWSYNGRGGASNIQFTAAGVASLLITQDFAHPNDDTDPARATAALDAAKDIERGLEWIGKNLSGHLGSPMLYALYGIERVGVASGRKYIGDIDWYNACADTLLAMQNKDGSWGPTAYWADTDIDTAFAILLLSRGREPVMMNKLAFNLTSPKTGKTTEADWNLRPRDVANVTRWVENQTEQRLNWQVVQLNVAKVDDLHDSNIAYLSGKMPISLTDDEKAKLKQFVEDGGMIIANAEGNNRFFALSFQTLMEELFPACKFNTLADNDGTTFSRQILPRGRGKPFKVEGLSNGARLLALLVPDGDLSAAFQKRDQGRQNAYQFVANAFLYSIEKTATRFKGQTFLVRPDASVVTDRSFTLARLNYGGAWNPEPGGWRRLAAIVRNEHKIDLQIKPVELGKDSLQDVPLAHLTGTESVQFTDAQRTALKEYLDKGGLLLIDNCGGNAAFDTAIRTEMTKLIPDAESQLLNPLPPEHPLFQAAEGKTIEPQYRPFALPVLGPLARHFQIRGLSINGKLAVLYSPHDLSVGLVGQPVDGITGYTPASATNLLRRLIDLKISGKF